MSGSDAIDAEPDSPFGGVAGGGLVYVDDDSSIELAWRAPQAPDAPSGPAPIASGIGRTGWLLGRRQQVAVTAAAGGTRRLLLSLLAAALLAGAVFGYADRVRDSAPTVRVGDLTEPGAPAPGSGGGGTELVPEPALG
jgi:hypothetical protein